MKILVVNCGSSSIKYKLYEMDTKEVLAMGGVERVGITASEPGFIKYKKPNGEKVTIEAELPTHTEGMKLVFDHLTHPEYGPLKSLDEIDAVGHRIVHGGLFTKSMLVDDEVIKAWEPYMGLAPLHSWGHLNGYNAVKEMLPGKKNVFVFDTAFHQTMPEHAYLYAIPYSIYKKYHIRRYGFHGTSHRYVAQRAAQVLGFNVEDKKIISCHIGNGASVAAIDGGKVVDTSMGLTPLEGLVMGTRTGDIDASAILYIMEKEGLSVQEANDFLNKKSGMLGLTEFSSDMRDIENGVRNGDARCILAQDIYCYRIKKYIGAYMAAMGGVDLITFTAGVAEHQWDIRSGAVQGLENFGIHLDWEKNLKNFGEEELISLPDSPVQIAVIPTDEELMIATDTLELIA